jgi:hypothetical protein
VDLGRIAFTTGGEEANIFGSSTVVVKRHVSTLYTGLKVKKVGMTTGTTGGSITKTCVDHQPIPSVKLLCRHQADYHRHVGDSGAPVYIRHWDGTAALIGIHWNRLPLFSTPAGIEADLGVTLDVCIPTGCATPPPPPEVEIEGATEVLEFSDCTYTADATGGYPPYSYQWYIDEELVEGPFEEEGELEVEVGSDSFWLQVRMEDSKGFIDWSHEVFVDVSPNHPNCDLSP